MSCVLSTLLWLFSVLLADCTIVPAHRVPNRTGEQCVWASLETQARHWGVRCLYDLTATYKRPASCKAALAVLRERKVRAYYSDAAFPRDWKFLEAASKLHWPVAVALRGEDYYHVITLIDLTATTVSIIDNSDPDLAVQTYSRTWFAELWDGWFIAIDPR